MKFQESISSIKQTCDACPSQWEGTLKDGRGFYIRYRWGWLSLRISTAENHDPVDCQEIFGMTVGHGLSGEISEPDMIEHLKDIDVSTETEEK